jgi:hypothetical protein
VMCYRLAEAGGRVSPTGGAHGCLMRVPAPRHVCEMFVYEYVIYVRRVCMNISRLPDEGTCTMSCV